MLKLLQVINLILILVAVTSLTAEPLSADYIPLLNHPVFQYADVRLWEYLRLGLNYLESPKPLYPPEAVSPTYIHPDLRGFGAYGFSPEAYCDVQRLYPFFRNYSWEDILHSQQLYELANQAFADWLLENLQDNIPANATKEQVFDVLHRAWNLGLSGFKNGREVIVSRNKRAAEFIKTEFYRGQKLFLGSGLL